MKISEARAGLARLVDRVMAGEEITLTRRGEAVAVLVSPAALRIRRIGKAAATVAAILEALQRGKTARLDDHPGIDEERAEALAAHVRESRRDDLPELRG